MKFEEMYRLLREQRARIARIRARSSLDEEARAELLAEQDLYDSRLVELARMLNVPLPEAMPAEGGLFADHRGIIEDRLAEAGADLRG